MSEMDYRRDYLILDLSANFSNDLEVSLEDFRDEEQIEILDLLIQVHKRMQQKEDYDDIYQNFIDPILTKYRSQSREFFNRKLTDYLWQHSNKLLDVMAAKKIHDPLNTSLSDDEYKQFMVLARNLIHGKRHFTYLKMEPEEKGLDGFEEDIEVNKKHTAKRRGLALRYLNDAYSFSHDKTPLAEFAHFLSGNSLDNLQKAINDPLYVKGKGEKGEQALKRDLEFVRSYFERMGNAPGIVKAITSDIDSIK